MSTARTDIPGVEPDMLEAYVPRCLRSTAPWGGAWTVSGALASVDVSGFTALSERLAALGREGAEELTRMLTAAFTPMVTDAEAAGGDVLTFGGDAMLVLFVDGWEHGAASPTRARSVARRAVAAMGRMTAHLAAPLPSPLVGPVRLRTSAGVHLGRFHLAVPDVGHRQLVAIGPDVSACLRAEAAAAAGELRVTGVVAEHLDVGELSAVHADGTATVATGRAADPLAETPPTADRDGGPPTRSHDASVFLPTALVDEVAGGGALGEHRRASVGFVRIGGVDTHVDVAGADAAARLVAEVVGALAAATARTGAHVLGADPTPDGLSVLLAAGAPTSVGDDEAALLGALASVVPGRGELTVRAGAHRGPVFAGVLGAPARRTLTVMGDAVNVAARLQQAAAPGQLLASRALLDRSSVRFAATDLAPLRVRNRRTPVRAAAVGARVGARVPVTSDGDAVLGREAQLAVVDQALDELRTGRGAALAVVGDPGSGRSLLAREVVRRATCCLALLETATRDERGAARGPVTRLLRRALGIAVDAAPEVAGAEVLARLAASHPAGVPLAPLLDVPLDAAIAPTPASEAIDARFRTARGHDQVVAALAALRTRPTVLVFDGLHHADDASRHLLEALARGAEQGGWLLLVTHPPDDEVALPGVRSVPLPPLDAEVVRALAVAATRDRPLHDADLDLVVARAGGNPMFARELALAVAEGGEPTEVGDAIESLATARIDRLPPPSRSLVRDLAVLGTEPGWDLARAVLGRDALRPERLDPAAEVVLAGATTVGFRHAVYQQAAYDGASFRRRRELHGRVAVVLAHTADPADPRRSLHLARAGDHAAAWHAALAAAAAAAARGAAADAFELYRRALAAADALPEPPPDLAEVAEAAGDQAEHASRYEAARRSWTRARETTHDVVAGARLTRKLGELEERDARYDDALAAYDDARAKLDAVADPDDRVVAERAELDVATAGVRHRQGDHAACRVAADAAAAAAARVGARHTLAHARYLAGHAVALAGGDARALMEEALAILDALDDPLGRANVTNNLGVQAYFAGRWDEATTAYERALADRRRAGDVNGAAMQVNNLAEIAADRGDWGRASACFEEARRSWQAVHYPVGVALSASNLGRTAARQAAAAGDDAGLAAACAALQDAVVQLTAIGAAGFADEARCRLAEAQLLRHLPEAAAAALADVTGPDPAGPPVAELAVLRRFGAFRSAQAGDLVAARELAEAAVAVAAGAGARYELALARIGLARIRWAAEAARGPVDGPGGDDPDGPGRLLAAARADLRHLGVQRAVVPTVDPAASPVVVVEPGTAGDRRGG